MNTQFAYILCRIHALPPAKRAKWATSSRNNFLSRRAREMVIAQWLAEVPQAS